MIEQKVIRLWVTTDGGSQYFSARFPAKAHDLASDWLYTILGEVVNDEKLLGNIVKVTWMCVTRMVHPPYCSPCTVNNRGEGHQQATPPVTPPAPQRRPPPKF
jgi:hypothetical protein